MPFETVERMGGGRGCRLHSKSPRASTPGIATTTTQARRKPVSDPVALYDAADKLKDEGKLEEAAAKLNEALQADQNYALAHSALAVVLQKLGRHEEAINHARKVCEIEQLDFALIDNDVCANLVPRARAGEAEDRGL